MASCAYGSPHQKEFALMTVGIDARCLARRCSRDHSHVKIQGKFTKPSATYCEGLAKALAQVFARHLFRRRVLNAHYELKGDGLEDALTNEVLLVTGKLYRVGPGKGPATSTFWRLHQRCGPMSERQSEVVICDLSP